MIDLKKIERLSEMLEAEVAKQFPGVNHQLTIDVYAHELKDNSEIVKDLKSLNFEESDRNETEWFTMWGKNKHITVFTV